MDPISLVTGYYPFELALGGSTVRMHHARENTRLIHNPSVTRWKRPLKQAISQSTWSNLASPWAWHMYKCTPAIGRWGARSHFVSLSTVADKHGGQKMPWCVCSTSPASEIYLHKKPPPFPCLQKYIASARSTLSPTSKFSRSTRFLSGGGWRIRGLQANSAGLLCHPRWRREDVRGWVSSTPPRKVVDPPHVRGTNANPTKSLTCLEYEIVICYFGPYGSGHHPTPVDTFSST